MFLCTQTAHEHNSFFIFSSVLQAKQKGFFCCLPYFGCSAVIFLNSDLMYDTLGWKKKGKYKKIMQLDCFKVRCCLVLSHCWKKCDASEIKS